MTTTHNAERDRLPLYLKQPDGPLAICRICAALVAMTPACLVRHHEFHGWTASSAFSPCLSGEDGHA